LERQKKRRHRTGVAAAFRYDAPPESTTSYLSNHIVSHRTTS
jgi:hypothetical protein